MSSSKVYAGIILIAISCEPALAQQPVAGNVARAGHAPFAHGGLPFDREVPANPEIGRFNDDDRHHGHRFGHWPRYGIGYWGYGGGYVHTEPTRDMFGFFGTGGEVEQIGGEAFYDYDRSYPYDWFDEPVATAGGAAADVSGGYFCETAWVAGEAGGQSVPVRICRR